MVRVLVAARRVLGMFGPLHEVAAAGRARVSRLSGQSVRVRDILRLFEDALKARRKLQRPVADHFPHRGVFEAQTVFADHDLIVRA